MKTININLGWTTEDGEPPPPEILDKVANKVRLWLHEQGLEGALETIEKNGKKVANIKLMKPDEWTIEEVKAFCNHVTAYIYTMCNPDEPPDEPQQKIIVS